MEKDIILEIDCDMTVIDWRFDGILVGFCGVLITQWMADKMKGEVAGNNKRQEAVESRAMISNILRGLGISRR